VTSSPSAASSAAHIFLLPLVWKRRTCRLPKTRSSSQLVEAFDSRFVAVVVEPSAKGFRCDLSFEKLCGFVGERWISTPRGAKASGSCARVRVH
jgi:hypothetical protein